MDWQEGTYRIMQQADGKIFASEVCGIVCENFGIHQTDFGWSVTHLGTGWSAFTSHTKEGALVIARHLIEHYKEEFDRLSVNGCEVSNYLQLQEKVTADEYLSELRRLYAYSTRQLKAEGRIPERKMEIVS